MLVHSQRRPYHETNAGGNASPLRKRGAAQLLPYMLTNDQALELIHQYGECFVAWATDENAILAVHPIPRNASATDQVAALGQMRTDYPGPTVGRFLSAENCTLETLTGQQREIERVARRKRVLRSWESLDNGGLIGLLCGATPFSAPMDARQDSWHLVERLYKSRGPSLTDAQLDQLEKFANQKVRQEGWLSTALSLQCYLAALRNAPEDLVALWRRHRNSGALFYGWTAFTEAAGDLAITDPDILDRFISTVEKSIFGFKVEAMIALGKIGPPAGMRAARVIQYTIHDSAEWVTALRDRALHRIQSRPSEWKTCPDCFHGYADRPDADLPVSARCPACLGYGHVPKEETSSTPP